MKWLGQRDKCDICGADTSQTPFVYGRIRATLTSWALMCLKCFKLHGSGLGIGKGQRFNAQGDKVER